MQGSAEKVSDQTNGGVALRVHPSKPLSLPSNALDCPVETSLTRSSKAAGLVDTRPRRMACGSHSSAVRERKQVC